MKCECYSAPNQICEDEGVVHLHRIVRHEPHEESTPERPVLVVTESYYVGSFCAKHARWLVRAAGEHLLSTSRENITAEHPIDPEELDP